MKYLLLGGAPSVGKTQTTIRVRNLLTADNYQIVVDAGITGADILQVLQRNNHQGENIRVMINSGSDDLNAIVRAKNFLDQNQPIDVVTSSVRELSNERASFFAIMQTSDEDFLVEIPLAKITRRGGANSVALNWYRTSLDTLIHHILLSQPYSLLVDV